MRTIGSRARAGSVNKYSIVNYGTYDFLVN